MKVDIAQLNVEMNNSTDTSNIDSKSSKEGEAIANFVAGRFDKMSQAKVEIRRVWEGTQDLYYDNSWEWIASGNQYNKPTRFPTLRDTIKGLNDMYMTDSPRAVLREKKDSDKSFVIGKQAYIDERLDSVHEKSIRRQIGDDMFFYGVGIRGVDYETITKMRPVFDKTAKKRQMKEIVVFDGIATDRVDPRDFFIDENCVKMHDDLQRVGARDCIRRHRMPLTTYKKYAKQYGFKDIAVVADSFFMTEGNDHLATNDREITEKGDVDVVKVYEYFNHEQDLYYVVVNKQCVFESTLWEAKGTTRLPFVAEHFEPRNDSFWGNTLAQIIAPHIYIRDILLNLEIMNLKLTLQPVLAVSGEFGYNKKTHVIQPGGIWESNTFDGKISDKISPVIAGNPNTNVYPMMQKIDGELSLSSRTNLRNLQFQKNKTATEVGAQSESMNAHIHTIESISEVETEGYMVKIMLEIMQNKMNAMQPAGGTRRVSIKDYTVDQNGEGIAQFTEKSGEVGYFELVDEMIDVNCDVVVVDKRSEIANQADKLGRIMQGIPTIGNLAQLDPAVMEIINMPGIVTQLLEYLGMDMTRSLKTGAALYSEKLKLTQQELLLGNEVPVDPEESRDLSIARFKYFMEFKNKLAKANGGKLPPRVDTAISNHIAAAVANASSNKLKQEADRKAAAQQQAMQQTQPGQEDITGGKGSLNVPGGSAIPQPDSSLLNASTNEPNK